MPLVCVSASVMELENRRHLVHGTGAKNIDAVERYAGCVPVMLPALGERLDVESFVERIDGLVLTGRARERRAPALRRSALSRRRTHRSGA